jgi:hypothetical protein
MATSGIDFLVGAKIWSRASEARVAITKTLMFYENLSSCGVGQLEKKTGLFVNSRIAHKSA